MTGGISGRTRIFGLVGHPVRHSLSPAMHTALFQRLGLDAVYVAFDVDPRRADQVADAIRTLDLVGVNLTVPFKERVLPHLDHVTLAAREAGAVNVVIQVDGHLSGYNTDGAGLLAALVEEHDWTPAGMRCAVLGAGGAGRAVAASLAANGAAQVTLHNRTVARAEAAIEQIGAPVLGAAGLADLGEVDLVVNCLGGGAEAAVEALAIDQLPDTAVWVDANYWMKNPPRLDACAARGLRTSTGLGMLVHQGALSFELFTGHPVDAAELREIVESKE
ncbi:MAG: shikimate dehydrogenase [Proteobacteria bacterium]|nr:shikimate dehydrogenase [Pseudomonadota bacterium]MCP4920796.1 shikimate dehydrogenase [Pseudomonadota bacterium]